MDIIGNEEPQEYEQVSTGKAKRHIAAAALLTGGLTVGALISPIGIADAQSDDTTADGEAEAEADSSEDAEGSETEKGHRGRRGAKLEGLSSLLGLTQEELRAQFGEGLSLAEIAEAEGVSNDELVDALVANIEERLAEAVANERIDQEQADERLAGAEERVQEFIERTPGERGEGRGGRGHHGHRGRVGINVGSDVLEDLLELSSDDIRAAMADGQSLAEIAEGAGVSSDDLVAALVDAAGERIDSAVADEKIDAEKAEELRSMLAERITERVNAEPGEAGPRGRGGFGRRGHGHGGPQADADREIEDTALTA